MRASEWASPIYESADLEAVIAERRYDAETAAFVRALALNGGALVELGDEARSLCSQAISETEAYFADGKVRRVQDAWYRSAAVRRLAVQAKVLRLLKAAYGRKPFAFQTLNFKQGSEQHFHSDAIQFHSLPERFMCGVWIALEDVHLEAGPLLYKRGSHRMPVLNMQDVGVNHPEPTYEQYVSHYVPRFEERLSQADAPTERLLLKRGQAFVWTANLAHGGEAIRDPSSTRRSLVTHFYFKGCTYFTPMNSNPQENRLALRLPPDIKSGLWSWPQRNGRPIRLPAGTIYNAVSDRWKSKPVTL